MQYRTREYLTHPYFTIRKTMSKSLLFLSRLSSIAGDFLEPNKWLSREDKRILLRNRELKDVYKGKRCFILGTGPSLNKCNLDFISDEISIGINSIWHHKDFHKWEPKAICYIHPIREEFEKSSSWELYFREFRKKVNKSILFTRLKEKEIIRGRDLFPKDRVRYLEFGKAMHKTNKFDFDLTHTIPGSKTVAQTAIVTAIYMGCNPIYLLGLNHNWLSYRGKTPHFFNNDSAIIEEEIGNTDFDTYDVLCKEQILVWQAYMAIKRNSDRLGVEIYNASADSFLDIFPFVKYEELFNK